VVTLSSGSSEISPEDILPLFASIVKIDVINFEVSDPTRDFDDRLVYEVVICGNSDVDESKATEAFMNSVKNGDTGSLDIESVEYKEESGLGSVLAVSGSLTAAFRVALLLLIIFLESLSLLIS
jgi:hypothetical protein